MDYVTVERDFVHVFPEHAAGYSAPYLSVYSENAVDVFDVNTMEWIQTIPLKKVNVFLNPNHRKIHSYVDNQ